MNHFIVRFIIGAVLGLAITALLMFNGLLLWVATGPRSLAVVTPYIERALTPVDGSFSVKINATWLIWDGWKHPLDIRLREVEILTHEKQRVSTFPEISLGIDLLSLFDGALLPTSLTITHPELSLFQNDDGSISLGFHKEAPTADAPPEGVTEVPAAAIFAPLVSPDANSNLRKLRAVTIVNADVTVSNRRRGLFFKASGVQATFKNNRHGIAATGSARISYDRYESLVSAQFEKPKDDPIIHGKIGFGELMPAALANLFVDNAALNGLKFPVSGEANVFVDAGGEVQQMNFSIDGGKGTIENAKLEGALPVTTLHAEGGISNKFHDIEIIKLNANLDGMLLDGDGSISVVENDTAIRANVFLKNVAAASMPLLWPPSLAPETRLWITKNITEGRITEAESHINIPLGDLSKPKLPKADIDTTIKIEGNTVRYLPEHPPLTQVKGSVFVDGLSLTATIDSAQFMKQTTMSAGSVVIDDLNLDNPYIKVAFDTQASVKDVVRFLDLPRLKHAKRLNLNADTADGTVKGHAAVGFSFYASNGDDDIAYDIQADVSGVTQPGFMDKFDIANAAGKVSVNNDRLQFKGSGEVNGATVSESNVTYLFKPDAKEKGFDTLIEATATAPVSSLPRFGYPAFPFIKGTLGVKASLKEGATAELAHATIDLTQASMELDLPAVHWSKADKEAGTLVIAAEKKNGVSNITSFQLTGKNVDIHGSAQLDKSMSDIQSVTTDKLQCGGTNLDRAVYEKIEDGFTVEARGNAIDIGPWRHSGGEGTFSFEHFPAVQVNLDVKQVTLGKGQNLVDLKGGLSCDIHRCETADINGATIDNKPFRFRILRNPKGNRQLSLHAQSAGAFLKAAGIFDGMDGGDLTVTGNYTDSTDRSVLKGSVDINDHTVKDAPVLARILSLASLTGFFDTLQGKGIAFVKLHAPFTLSKDVITFKDAKTHGSAMGMTMGGTITFPKRTLDLQGTIVPSYTLNNVLGKVPIVGHMLTGGEGQGVFAARYSITGSDAAPDVSVNPLSILTPGFLRGLFDVFDGPSKKSDDEAE